MEHLLMPGIIEFSQVVQDALAQYGDLFANYVCTSAKAIGTSRSTPS
jgi:hypothetical protein